MKQKTEQMYATMKPWRLFFVVALPGMVSMFAMSVYSVFEGAFIGHILGKEAFASVLFFFARPLASFLAAILALVLLLFMLRTIKKRERAIADTKEG